MGNCIRLDNFIDGNYHRNAGGISDSEQHWRWVKDICKEAVYMAIDKGWAGICTSNFSQPHFKGMWDDIEWHKELTTAIRQGGNDMNVAAGSAQEIR